MELILWRHADAEDGFPDTSRQLTATGQEQARRMSKWLQSQLPDKVSIKVSPAMRTQQTAMALGLVFETCPEVGPGARVIDILAVANWPGDQGVVLIVGHQPTLGQVVNQLIPAASTGMEVKKGSVWWIKSQQNNGIVESKLHTVMYPEML